MNKKLYDLMDWAEIETIVYSEHDHPESVLGPHKVKGGYLVQAFLPGAESVFLKYGKDGKLFPMEEADEAGFFAVFLAVRKMSHYEFVVEYKNGREKIVKDPYQYTFLIAESDLKKFSKGEHDEIYRVLGAHKMKIQENGKEISGIRFGVWAPNALRVSVVGDFNQWDGRIHQMMRLGESGVFSIFIPELSVGELYKYEIKMNATTVQLKSDPYGFAMELRPANASIITDISGYAWKDQKWMHERAQLSYEEKPMSIYEVHLGSWKKGEIVSDENGNNGAFLNYRELARELAAYIKQMGYTHIELLPVMEHPLDESWGYQVTGYYAVTSRYGTPEDFMYFVDYMHQKGIGVIIDWVPAHFPKDSNGLARFDGTCLYEHLDPRQGEHPHWGTLIYNYARPQVSNFLTANALFWKEVYHVDAIRVDAVASMLYLDYGRNDGEWIPNENGGKENYAAVHFLQKLSTKFHEKKDGALLIAEESTAWPKVTGTPEEDGLGFDFKWNMGWMNDFLNYMRLDPYFRKGSHGALVFSMIYHYSEKFILMFSHDEVVHEKGSMLRKMPGEDVERYANLRVAYGYMMTHPGKKLMFMGQEFAQESEWNEGVGLPWQELQDKKHQDMQTYVKEWNRFYKAHPALYEADYDVEGFEWLSCMDADHSIIAFLRKDKNNEEQLLVVCNFTPVLYENFKVGVPYPGRFKEIFNSDKEIFGGTGFTNSRKMPSKPVSWDGRPYSLTMNVPPLGISVFACFPEEEK